MTSKLRQRAAAIGACRCALRRAVFAGSALSSEGQGTGADW